MFHKKRYDHTNPLFCEHNLLKVPDIIFLQTCIFLFKSIYIYPNNTSYELLSNNINNNRRPDDLKLPLCRTVHAQRSVSVRGVREWNSLPHEIKSLTSINLFKRKVKCFLLLNLWMLTIAMSVNHVLLCVDTQTHMSGVHILWTCVCTSPTMISLIENFG